MAAFLKKIALFGIFAAVFYLLAVIVWGSTLSRFFPSNVNYRFGKAGHTLTRFQEVKSQKDLDILFVGSSHAYRTFDTRIYSTIGLNTFNLGSSAQSPMQTEVLLKRYLLQLNPKTVVFEVSPIIMDLDGVEAATDLISNDKFDVHALQMVVDMGHIKPINTAIFAQYRQCRGDLKNVKEPVFVDDDQYIKGGFVQKDSKDFTPSGKETPIEIKFNALQLQALKNCITIIKKQGAEVILVYTPVTKALYSRYVNNHFFDKKMSNLGTYINLNGLINLIDSLHFYDDDHLNQKGVELVNEYFIISAGFKK